MNECLRCGRELKNPDDLFGWRCAEKIGIPINFKVENEEDLLKLLTTLYLEDAKDGSLSPHNTWLGDVFTGLAPFSGNMDLLQTKYTNIVMKPKTLKDGTVRHYLFDTKTNTRLFEFDSHGFNTKSGRTKPLPHINVKSKPNANVFQTKLANALDHKKSPNPSMTPSKTSMMSEKSSKKVVKQLRLSVLSWTLSTSEQPSMTTIRTTDILARKPYHRQHESAEAGLVPRPAQKAEQHWGRWSAVCFREQAM